MRVEGQNDAPPQTFEHWQAELADEHAARQPSDLEQLIDLFRDYVHLPDVDHVIAVMATAVTRDAPGDPLWLQLVAPPSSSKTETIRLLDHAVDYRLDEVLGPAALMRWVPVGTGKSRSQKPAGMLADRAGQSILATIADFSTILALSDRGSRDQLFAALRRVYDGSYSRELGNGPRPLEWHGRLTLVSAVTPALDEYSAHADMLGPRWVNYRLTPPTRADRRKAVQAVRAGQAAVEENRRKAADKATEAVASAAQRLPTVELDHDLGDYIDDCAIVCAQGRGTVPRESYGRRDVKGMPVIEEPPRLVGQLTLLARGVLALGQPAVTARRLVRRVAVDSMPPERHQVLRLLADGAEATASGAARVTGLHRHVARRVLEDLDVLGVVNCDADYEERETDESAKTKPIRYILDGPDAALIARVCKGE